MSHNGGFPQLQIRGLMYLVQGRQRRDGWHRKLEQCGYNGASKFLRVEKWVTYYFSAPTECAFNHRIFGGCSERQADVMAVVVLVEAVYADAVTATKVSTQIARCLAYDT
jgi:hypothetical protein